MLDILRATYATSDALKPKRPHTVGATAMGHTLLGLAGALALPWWPWVLVSVALTLGLAANNERRQWTEAHRRGLTPAQRRTLLRDMARDMGFYGLGVAGALIAWLAVWGWWPVWLVVAVLAHGAETYRAWRRWRAGGPA